MNFQQIKEEIIAGPKMPERLGAVIDGVRQLFADANFNLNDGLNVLVALLAAIEDDLEPDQRSQFRAAIMIAWAIQAENLAEQAKPTAH